MQITSIQPEPRQKPELQQPLPSSLYKDEVNMIDLFVMLVRRKNIILIALLISILIGVLITWFKPNIYEYESIVEIGSYWSYSDSRPVQLEVIELPEHLLAKINQVYIPSIKEKINDEKMDKYLDASIVRNSNLIALKCRGVIDQENTCNEALKIVIDKIYYDHKRRILTLRQGMKNKLEPVQEKRAGDIQPRLSLLLDTKTISENVTSDIPVGYSKRMIFVLCVFSGLVLGIVIVLLVEFVNKVKARLETP